MGHSLQSEKAEFCDNGSHAAKKIPADCSTIEEQSFNVLDELHIAPHESNCVDFDKPKDPENPQDWPNKYKYVLIGLLSAMQTMVNLGTLMCTPVVPVILASFGAQDNWFYSVLLVSIWELGEACGPLLVAPLSEYFGRLPVYHSANIMFTIWSLASGWSPNAATLIAFRFLNGLCVASITLDAAVVGDLFPVEKRGTVQSILGLAPLIGPVFGPTIGGFISESIGWRWMFWFLAICSGSIEIGFICLFRETYKVTILRNKTKRLRTESGNEKLQPVIQRPSGFQAFMRKGLVRPVNMLFSSRVLMLLTTYVSIMFSYLYILLTTLTPVFEKTYGFSTRSASLVYIGIGSGMVCGMFCCRFTLDRYVRRQTNKGGAKPEHRLLPMAVGGLVVPIGLLIYGWTAQAGVHWIAPVIGLAVCGFSVATTLISSFSYAVDAFCIHAASAMAAMITTRCIIGVVLPLAGPPLFAKLDLGWGSTLLALIAALLAPIPLFMKRAGERMRNNSKQKIIA